MGRFFLWKDIHSCVAHSCQIQWLADSVFSQKPCGKQFIRMKICKDSSVFHKNDAVYISPQNILETMLDDHYSSIRFFLDLIDQLNGLLASGRIKVRQRLIKQKDFYLIHHNACKTYSLLLTTGKLMRCIVHVVLNPYQFCRMAGDLMHLILGRAAVFQGKSNVFPHCQADKLSVRVL